MIIHPYLIIPLFIVLIVLYYAIIFYVIDKLVPKFSQEFPICIFIFVAVIIYLTYNDLTTLYIIRDKGYDKYYMLNSNIYVMKNSKKITIMKDSKYVVLNNTNETLVVENVVYKSINIGSNPVDEDLFEPILIKPYSNSGFKGDIDYILSNPPSSIYSKGHVKSFITLKFYNK